MSSLTDLFSNIANAIREKTGSSETIQASGFPAAIATIPTGSTVTITQYTVANDGDKFVVPEELRGSTNILAVRRSGSASGVPGGTLNATFLDLTGGNWAGIDGYQTMSGGTHATFDRETGIVTAREGTVYSARFVAARWLIYTW